MIDDVIEASGGAISYPISVKIRAASASTAGQSPTPPSRSPAECEADDELRSEIQKDISRTNPDLNWFAYETNTAPMVRDG